jgi:glycosyltransferase involved in cell wall biosynthesis
VKLLVVVSSLDLRAPLGVTPSLWQLLKALAICGAELVVAPYQGPAIESPWWTAAANPCEFEGDVMGRVKRLLPKPRARTRTSDESGLDRFTRNLVERITLPRWRHHLRQIVERQPDVSALLFLCTPPNHFVGVPSSIERDFGTPSYFFDGDVPASLPRFAGFQSGFRIYQGADLGEYAGVLSSSKGGIADLEQLGARRVELLYYAADPDVLSPVDVAQDIDVFFYGLGREYREKWLDAMLDLPSRALPDACFAVRGTRLGDLPRVKRLPYASFSALKSYCCRSRVNLLITRDTHANVYASSNARPFELAALGCAMVSNPYLGIEEWFEPDRELLIVHSADEAITAYRELLAHASLRAELGACARQRLLKEHTYQHRATQLLDFIGSRRPQRQSSLAQAVVG